jgi:PAS domain S-box-containing protein
VRLEDMMTRDFATLRAEDNLQKAVNLLRNSQRDGLPVLKEDFSLAGIFTKTNLYDALIRGTSLQQPVRDFYNHNVVKIKKDLDYQEVIDLVKRIPVGTGVVVDNDERVVGLFTKVELITALFKEEQLLNSRLQAICKAMHNALVSVDFSGNITYINRAAAQLFNLLSVKVEGRPAEEVLPDLDLQPVLNSGQVSVGGKYQVGETTAMVNKTPLIDGGKIVGAIASFQDVTELETIAQEMGTVKRLNQTLKTVLDIGYDALVVVNESGSVVLVNRIFLDFIKREEETVLNCPINTILENSRLHIVVKTGIPELNDIQFIGGKPYVVSRLPIIRDGQVIGAVGKISFRRVDELRELASRLETMNNRLAHFREELKKERFRERPYVFKDIITVNPMMQELIREAKQASRGLSTVLISGESGVGKELLAQAIHQEGPRRDKAFLRVNCAAIPENLLESEFFGYEEGAFTGARREGKRGRLDLANGGTLFLDEIGDLPILMQGKLLRALEEQTFERIGGTKTEKVDVRFLAATNQDLEKKVREGTFRKDLFFRLNVIHLLIPPLRERIDDILPLIHAFLRKYNKIFNMQVTEIDPLALLSLQKYHWPGNVRELENIIERALNFASDRQIGIEHLPPHLRQEVLIEQKEKKAEVSKRNIAHAYRDSRAEQEKAAIYGSLLQAGGNRSEAARILGISRSWLYEKMKRFNLD